MKTQHHFLKTEHRTWLLSITEHPDSINIQINTSKTGTLGDELQFQSWAHPFISPYENDPRPFSMVHPVSHQIAVIHQDFTVILPPA
jgi:hypothetical protein